MKIAKKLMIINEALNRVTSRRIERRFLPSVRAASENANRKRIQDLSLEVIRVRSWGGGEVIDIFFQLFSRRISGEIARRHVISFSQLPLEKVNFKGNARASAKSRERIVGKSMRI